MEKQNDWLAILSFQPDLSLDDLVSAGISTENTGMKSKEAYKEIPKVVEMFSKDGKFDEAAFDSFYDQSLILYNNFANNETELKIAKEYDYDPWDWRREGNKRDVSARYASENNPMMNTFGIKGLGLITDSTFSVREIAQTNKIFDTESGQWLDYTPNDLGLFKSLTAPTCVLATYDQDEDEEINGQVIHHKKGDFKLDPDGKPFYETLGNRESYDKEVLQITDTLTTDGSFWNKFDFFDSDGLRKSVGGTIMKYAMRLAPTLIPVVGEFYGAISGGIALAQALPTLGKAIDGFFTGDALDDDFGKAMNKWEGYASRFQGNMSDRGREHQWSLENIGKMISDVSLQLMQQRSIAKIPYILKANPYTKQNIALARNLSYAYMSLTSAQDTYSTFKQAGASDRIAGLGMLAAIGGYYTLMAQDYFKPLLFESSWLNEEGLHNITMAVGRDMQKIVEKEAVEGGKKAAGNILKRLKTSFIKHIKEGPKTFIQKSFSEAIEEVSEEAMIDAIKCLNLGAEALGIPVGDQKLDFGLTAEDIFTRYTTSFIGGFLGGAIFEGYNKLPWIGGPHNITEHTPEANIAEFNYHILEGRADELRRNINKAWKNGKFGSTSLSGTKLQIATDVDGEQKLVSSAEDQTTTQNDLVRQALLDQVDYMERIIQREGFQQSLDAHKKMWERLKTAYPEDLYDRLAFDSLTGSINNLVEKDLIRLSTKAVRLQSQLDKLVEEMPKVKDSELSSSDFAQALKNNETYKNIKAELDEVRKDRDEITNGTRMLNYIRQSTFGLNANMMRGMLGFGNIEEYTQFNYGKRFDELNPIKQAEVKEEYDSYFNGENDYILGASDVYWAASEKLASDITALAKDVQGLASVGIHTTGIERYLVAIDEKAKKLDRIAQIDNGESTPETDAEKVRLAKEVSDLEEEIKTLRNNPSFGQQKYTKEFVEVIAAASPDVLQGYARTVLEGYEEAVDKKQIVRDDDALNAVMTAIDRSRGNVDVEKVINTWVNEITNGGDPDVQAELGVPSELDPEFTNHLLSGRANISPIIQTIGEFKQNLNIDYKKALNSIQTLRRQLRDLHLNDEQITKLLYGRVATGYNENGTLSYSESILPIVDGEYIETYLGKVDTLRSRLKDGSARELIDKFLIAANDSDKITVFDLLEEESKRLAQNETLSDYTYNKVRAEQINYALNVIGAVKAVVSGSIDNLNRFNNKTAKEAGIKAPEFAEIDEPSGKIILEDLTSLENKFKNLKKLNEVNSGVKLKIQKEIGVNMRVKFLSAIKFHSEAIKDKFGETLDIDQILLDTFPPEFKYEDLTIDNYEENEQYYIAFETAVFNAIKALNLDNKTLAKNIIEIFAPKSLYKQNSSRLSEKSDINISDYDTALYFATLGSINSNDFYASLNEIIKNEESKIVPIYGQEYALKQVYAMVLNPELFNELIRQTKGTYEGNDEYVKHKKELENMSIVFGGAGTGKTVGVGYLLFKMLGNRAEFILAAPTDSQLQNLQKSLHTTAEETKSILTDPLMDTIKGNWDDPHNVTMDKEAGYYEQIDSSVKTSTIFDPESPVKILLIDEIGTLSSLQLKNLSDYAVSKGIIVVGLGDYKQMSGQLKYARNPELKENSKIDTGTSSFEDCFVIKTPALTATLRSATQGKVDNYNILDSRLDTLYQEILSDNISEQDVNTRVSKLPEISLSYYYQGDRLAGDMITTQDSVYNNALDLALQHATGKDEITIIVDKNTESKYKDVAKYKNCKIQLIENAQGGEFKYAFVDVKSKQNTLYDDLRFLYTATQRSQIATVVLDTDNYYSGTLHISSHQDSNAANPYGGSEVDAEFARFKTWRINALSKLKPSAEFEKNMTPGTIYEEPVKGGSEPSVIEEKNAVEENLKKPEPTVNPSPSEESSTKSEPEPEPIETPKVETEEAGEEAAPEESTSSTPEVVEEKPAELSSKPKEKKIISASEVKSRENTKTETRTAEVTSAPKRKTDVDKIRNIVKSLVSGGSLVVNSKNFYDEMYNDITLKTHLKDLMKFDKMTTDSARKIATRLRNLILRNYNGYNFEAIIKSDALQDIIPTYSFKTLKTFLNSGMISGKLEISPDHWMRLIVSDGKTGFSIPIMYNEGWNPGVYIGSFRKLTGVGYNSDGNVTRSIAELEKQYPGIQFGNYGAILVRTNEFKDYFDADSQAWLNENDGKTMLAINCDDPIVSWESTVYKGTRDASGKTWAYSRTADIAMAGVQTIGSLDDIVRMAIALVGKHYGLKSDRFKVISNIATALNINRETDINEILTERTGISDWRTSTGDNEFGRYFYKAIMGSDILDIGRTQQFAAQALAYMVNKGKHDQLMNFTKQLVGVTEPYTIHITNNGNIYNVTFGGGKPHTVTVERIVNGVVTKEVFNTTFDLSESTDVWSKILRQTIMVGQDVSEDAKIEIYRTWNGQLQPLSFNYLAPMVVTSLFMNTSSNEYATIKMDLEEMLRKSSEFRNGIYLNIKSSNYMKESNYFKHANLNKENTFCDISDIEYPNYEINQNRIVSTTTAEVAKDNTFEIDDRIKILNRVVSPIVGKTRMLEFIRQAYEDFDPEDKQFDYYWNGFINYINDELIKSTRDFSTPQLDWDSDRSTVKVDYVDTQTQAIQNLLTDLGVADTNPEEVVGHMPGIWTTAEGNYYHVENVNGVLKIKQINSFKTAEDILTRLRSIQEAGLADLMNGVPTTYSYRLGALIDTITEFIKCSNNENISDNVVNKFMSVLTDPISSSLGLNNYLNAVMDYLNEKLENNEC